MLSDVNGPTPDDLLKLERRPTAKRLILSLLSQPNMTNLSFRQLVAWGELLNQKPAAIRVTAGRLVKEDLLETVRRGVDRIGPAAMVFKNMASEWKTALDQIRDWNEGWLCVHTAHLSNANRRNVRDRTRAFRLFDFKELVDGVWIRPDNLTYTATQMYAELCQLGLEPDAVLLRADVIAHGQTHSLLNLRSGNALNAGFDKGVELLQRVHGGAVRCLCTPPFGKPLSPFGNGANLANCMMWLVSAHVVLQVAKNASKSNKVKKWTPMVCMQGFEEAALEYRGQSKG